MNAKNKKGLLIGAVVIVVIVVVLVVMFLNRGDKNQLSVNNSASPVATAVQKTPAPAATEQPAQYKEMMKNSLMSTGNNFRMKQAIEKAKRGEDVTIAYIGGSITEGYNASSSISSYAYLFYQNFCKTYCNGDNTHVKYVNAGMAGTPSTLGMIRYQRDVLDKAPTKPDIVFVEFAVNDGDDPTQGDCYESLVRNILKSDDSPAVVLLFSVFKTRWNLQERLKPVGEYYNLPMISIKDAILPQLDAGSMTNDDFWSDEYHPTDYGHQIMADCMSYCVAEMYKQETSASDITIPEQAKIGKSFENIKIIDSGTADANIVINPGSFNGKDTTLGSFKYDGETKTFPNNWMHKKDSANDVFSMELNCKNLSLVYKKNKNSDAGAIDVYVDGKLSTTIDSYDPNGWNNPYTQILFNDKQTAKHKIEIKMEKDSKKKDFSVLAFGYTE